MLKYLVLKTIFLKIKLKKLYWKNDVHFNFKGHNEFALFERNS